MRKKSPKPIRKSNASRWRASRAWLSKKKAAWIRWFASRDAADWSAPESELRASAAWREQSAANKDLALALERAPFRTQRVARALRRGASFKTLVAGRSEGWGVAGVASDHGVMVSSLWVTLANEDRPEHWAGFGGGWRGEPDKRLWALWDWMESSGVEMGGVDDRGEGFEHCALRLGNESALWWWKSKGRGPDRGGGSPNLAESALVRDQLGMVEDLARIWPEAGLMERMAEALKNAARLISEYWGEGVEEDQLTRFSQRGHIRARVAAARAAEAIVEGYPEAARANRELSNLLGQLGERAWRGRLIALESAAMARAEREEIAVGIGAAGGQGRRAL